MKTILTKLSPMLLAMILMFACSDNEKQKKELKELKAIVDALKAENASLKSGEEKLKASIEQYNKFLKEIEQNLAEIDKNKEMIATLNVDTKGDADITTMIRNRVANLKALVENSRLKIVALDRSLNELRKVSEGKSQEVLDLDRHIKNLTVQIIEKDEEIELLDDKLEEMEELYKMEAQDAEELKAILNRAYFISASEKKLKSLGVIAEEGGFIGIGRVKMIKANLSDTVFTQIEKDQMTEFTLNTKKARVITQHPEGSYELVKDGNQIEKIVITDQSAFWRNGNYLVVQIDN